MNSSRTCQRCGVRSQREEMFTSLCLDVFLDATVEQLLQDYQQTVPVDYACRCGSNKSIMASTFHTLPQNLILQLKRFKTATMEKRHDAVHLSPELQVPTHLSDRFYRLVSIISHSGTTPDSGHYRSFGLHPDQRGGQRWLCYDDNIVSATRGPDVFRGVQETAYVLFYQKQRTC
ncbi:ubiquitin carboxyl-terminal hydrolase 46-like [Antennarius striatus]|uniref:ubiquitin carboxyl-terminal hydrolase 46-like n=1 Tax=Antennarius striatus TaxID=241820 RepID=UPI0035AFD5BD